MQSLKTINLITDTFPRKDLALRRAGKKEALRRIQAEGFWRMSSFSDERMEVKSSLFECAGK
jgi:hypothetical protein